MFVRLLATISYSVANPSTCAKAESASLSESLGAVYDAGTSVSLLCPGRRFTSKAVASEVPGRLYLSREWLENGTKAADTPRPESAADDTPSRRCRIHARLRGRPLGGRGCDGAAGLIQAHSREFAEQELASFGASMLYRIFFWHEQRRVVAMDEARRSREVDENKEDEQ